MPEKSGMDAAPGLPLVAGPDVGTAVCPKVGVAAVANAANRRKPCGHALMIALPSQFVLRHFGGWLKKLKSGGG
jgi:hypothetical protein